MKIITVCNQKGGVGKTSVAVNLLAGVDHLRPDLRKLAVDLDPQGHFSYILLGKPDAYDPQKTAANLFQAGRFSGLDIIHRSRFPGVDVIPANILLFSAREENQNMDAKGARLRDYLEIVASGYDLCIVDTPPDLGIFVLNGLLAATHALVPTDLGYLSVLGIADLWRTIAGIQEMNPGLSVLGVLPNKFNRRLREHNAVLRQLKKLLGDLLLEGQAISVNAPMSRAIAKGQTIFEYDNHARSHKQFRELAEWVLGVVGIDARRKKGI